MISEIDLLRADIPRLEQKFGVGDPFVRWDFESAVSFVAK
jgi:hypothetical protein